MNQNVIGQIAIVVLETTIWSGRRKLRPEDIAMGQGGRIPPEDVVSLGSKKICDPERIAEFQKIATRMERDCLAVGTRFLRGFAVPKDKVDELAKRLDAHVVEFETAKKAFLDSYDAAISKWIEEHEDYAEPIRRAVLPASDVAHRLDCGYTVFRIEHDAGKPEQLDAKVSGLPDQLYREIATDAEEAFQRLLKAGDGACSRRAARPLRRLHDKLEGLGFLDSGILRLTSAIRPVIDRLANGTGPLENSEIMETLAVVNVLSSVERIKSVTQGLMSVAEYAPEQPIAAEEKKDAKDPDEQKDQETGVEPAIADVGTGDTASSFYF